MSENSFERFRLRLMQDVLPVSLAMLERVKQKGMGDLLDTFLDSSEPLQELRDEGEYSAQELRERLDNLKPGLGNPVMPVSVEVDITEDTGVQDEESLSELLHQIESRLHKLETLLDKKSQEGSFVEQQGNE